MQDFRPPIIEPFDYKANNKRQGEFIAGYLEAVLLREPAFQTPEKASAMLTDFMKDAMSALSEVKRLYGEFDGLKRRHMPHPGVPGAPVKCSACSLHGSEVLWPCETYKAADSALPEGWPS